MSSKEMKLFKMMINQFENKGDDKSQMDCDSNVAKTPITNNNHKRVDDDLNMLRPNNDKRHRDNNHRWSSPGNNSSINKTVRTVNNGDDHVYYGPSDLSSKPNFREPFSWQ